MNLPPEDFRWLDDMECQMLAMESGVLHSLAVPTSPEDADWGFIGATDHTNPTHWLVFVRFYGHEDPRNNGFIACGWQKNVHNWAQANRLIGQLFAGLRPETVRVQDVSKFS